MNTPRAPLPGGAASGRHVRTLRRVGLAALAAGVVLLALFGVRSWHQYQFAQRVASGQVQVESIRGWMTLPYVARLHRVPEQRLREALGLPASGGDDRSLREWFEWAGLDPLEGRRRVEAVVQQARTAPPPP